MGVHTISKPMNIRVTPTDRTSTIIVGLIILVIIGVIGYRYWYLPKVNGDGKFPWDKKN